MLKNLIPSMFHRRLLLIGAAGTVCLVAIGAQTANLASGDSRREKLASLQSKLIREKRVPTIRGQIVDRTGQHVLARDAPGYDITVAYGVLDGRWAHEQAVRAARLDAGDAWSWMTDEEKEGAVQEHELDYLTQIDGLWTKLSEMTGHDLIQLTDRVNQVRQKVQYSKVRLWEIWRQREEKRRGQAVPLSDVAQPIAEELATHAVLFDVDPLALDKVRERVAAAERSPISEVWDQVAVERPKLRLYPNALQTVVLDKSTFPSFARSDAPLPVTVDGVGLQLIGTLRGAIAKDVKTRPLVRIDADGHTHIDLGGYEERDDQAGAFGIERAMESTLRGRQGLTRYRLDTQEKTDTPTVPGQDVQLTLDIELQAAVQALGSQEAGLAVFREWYDKKAPTQYNANGTPIPGAAVVLEIETGHVLAATSWPTPSTQDVRENLSELFSDSDNMPMVYRPFSRPLPPGSTVKPLLYVMAVTAGRLTADDTVFCPGFLDLNHNGIYDTGSGREPRCWIYHNYKTGHKDCNGRHAIEVSCNTYFYSLGKQVGATTLTDWYSLLGFGQKTGVGVLEESSGLLPSPRNARELDNQGVMEGVYMGIGQGRIDATPIQVANAYATLARHGKYLQPTVIDIPREDQKTYDLGFDAMAMKVALGGMRDVTEGTSGSARHLRTNEGTEKLWNVAGIDVIGKSGTAQNTGQRRMIDDDGDGYPDGWGELIREGNHGWFVTLVRSNDDTEWKYVVVTVMEHAGGGGMTAAPINNQVHRLLQERGYLNQPKEQVASTEY